MLQVRNICLAILSITLLCRVGSAQSPTTLPPGGNEMHVSIITMGPGDAAWEKFGHNMLRIQIPSRQIDAAFNWGLFEFDNQFIGKFLSGRLLYWMAALPTQSEVDGYIGLDRDIWEQELNLSSSQKQAIWDFCVWNAQPENKHYLYDYYKDNCSTRVRDAVDLVLAGQIRRKASTMPSPYTYRSETNRLMASDPFVYTGIYFILGEPIDNPMSIWDEMFIPMRLREHLNGMTFTDENGHEAAIVKSETLLHKGTRTPPPEKPPQLVGWFLAIGLIVGGLPALMVGRVVGGATRWFRLSFAIITVLWAFLAGFGGWFMIYAWTTDHWAVRYNENILQLSPLLFPLIVLIPRALARRRNAGKMAFLLASVALAASLIGLAIKVLPSMYQTNANILALAIPANVGLAWSMWKIRDLPALEKEALASVKKG